jgi:hypothetical protein
MMGDETGGTVNGGVAAGSSSGPPMPDTFVRFKLEHWVAWIRKFLNEELCEPAITVGNQEHYTALAGLYESLETESQRDLFADAVGDLFAHTPLSERKAKVFRSLIELLAMLTPYKAREAARRRLYLRSFAGMEDDGLELHTLLLIANCKYPIDEELADFIERTAQETDDFGYLLVCLRAVSEPGGKQYLRFLDIALPHLNTQQRAVALALEVGDIIFLHGCRHFCKWYSAAARDVSREDDLFDAFERFEGALKKHVFPELHLLPPNSADPYRTLVAAQLHVYDRRFSAKEVLEVARLYPQAGKATTVNALVNIWRRIETVFPDDGVPWYYNAPPARQASNGGPLLPAYLSSGPNPETSVSATFYEAQEPVLAEIFETVKDICYGVPEPEIARPATA